MCVCVRDEELHRKRVGVAHLFCCCSRFIINVKDKSPASDAMLMAGDYLVKVCFFSVLTSSGVPCAYSDTCLVSLQINETNVVGADHSMIVDLMRVSGEPSGLRF